jgi:hypothetical protein
MVAVPNFMTKSAALAGAISAEQANAAAAATAKNFPVIVPTPMVVRVLALIMTACQFGKFADYNEPTALAKG